MTRKEYIAALDQYLVTMSASEKADILSDYEEHFRVGLENGKTESQIAASLGSPYDVANQFLEGEKPNAPQYPQQRQAQTPPQSYSIQQRPAQAPPQGYSVQQRPAQTPQQRYTPQQRPTQTPPQGYSVQQRPSQMPPQGYAAQQRPAQTPPQGYAAQQSNRQQEIYDKGTQNYAQAQRPQQEYSAQQGYHSQQAYDNDGYADYDRQAAQRQYSSNRTQSSGYNTTGLIILIVLCVLLIPTVGSTLLGLLIGLYSSVIGFAAAGGSLIAVGAALSAQSLWICIGLIFIGISFIALTGLLIMGSIEGTKLFVKLIKYCIKEGKKLVTEGSF